MADDDRRWMSRALELAARGELTTRPNPRVGCVIVGAGAGVIVGEGFHLAAGQPHAEVHALAQAGAAARGACAYVSLEPCSHFGRTPPCTSALIDAGVGRVVAAMLDPDPRVSGRGVELLRAAGIEVVVGCLAEPAERLNDGFLTRVRTGAPFVRCKLAMSLDGRTAMSDGASKWITSPAARREVQQLRARSAAVVTGVGTILADDPRLDVRVDELEVDAAVRAAFTQPLRVIVDSGLRTPSGARTLQALGAVLIATTSAAPASYPPNVEVVRFAGARARARVPLAELLAELGRRAINEVLVEAGAGLAGGFAAAGLVDEYVFFVAPRILGVTGRPLLGLAVADLDGSQLGEIVDVALVGPDLRVTVRPGGRRLGVVASP